MSEYIYEEEHGGKRPSVAALKAAALAEVERLREAGEEMEPISVKGRQIAHKFWGKGWYRHIESFSDCDYGLPQGRSAVRNGAVCHLELHAGEAKARVFDERLYEVWVRMDALEAEKWRALKARCSGEIGSLMELLQGKISDEIMEAVTDPDTGMFPLEGEMQFSCDCPEYADMCKHVAAVMYGIAVRLDTQPALLFLLRGVDHEELLSVDCAADGLVDGDGSIGSRRRAFSGSELGDVFGIELEE